MVKDWIIAGEMRILRKLEDSEVAEICGRYGFVPLKRFTKYRAIFERRPLVLTKTLETSLMRQLKAVFVLLAIVMSMIFPMKAWAAGDITVSGTITWDDNNNSGGTRPARVTVYLLRDEEVAGTQQATAAGNWGYSFTVPADDGAGHTYEYMIVANPTPNYTVSYSGTNITETLVVPTPTPTEAPTPTPTVEPTPTPTVPPDADLPAPVEEAESTTPRMVFRNVKSDVINLYVRKNVTTMYAGSPAPDETFAFYLRLNGKPEKNREYYVRDEKGQRLYYYADGFSTIKRENEMEETLKTDRNGRFLLKAGYMAVFEGVEEDMGYEIEEETKSEWTQTVPAGGVPAVGTITGEGALVDFTNRYEPEIPPETLQDEDIPQEVRKTFINVLKSIVYPPGYEVPQSDDFTFTLTVSNQPWANKPYTVNSNGNYSTHTTAADGTFTLKGGESATFNDIPENADYSITETPATDWRLVSSTHERGAATAAGAYATFTNAGASFGVSKMVDGTTNDTTPFTFTVTDENGDPLSLEYYLYSQDKHLIDQTAHTSAADGTFTLSSGQTAIFFGLPTGAKYNVVETAEEGYQQVTPGSMAGYTNKTVQETVEVVPFVNYLTDKADLTVTKELTGQYADMTKSFNFTLTLSAGDVRLLDSYVVEYGGTTESRPLIGGNRYTFTLKDGESFTVKDLPVGTTYVLDEANYESELYYAVTTNNTGSIDEDKEITFTNNEGETNVQFQKLNIFDEPIPNAGLTITGRQINQTTDITPITWMSGSDGTTGGVYNPHTVKLLPGNYTLTETTTPESCITADPIDFVVMKDGSVTVGGKTVDTVSVGGYDTPLVEMVDEYVTHDISVEKTVSGNMGDRKRDYEFTILFMWNRAPMTERKITWTKGEEDGSDVTDDNGQIEFALAHGESITFHDIPAGVSYIVMESDYDAEGYRVTKTNDAGRVATEDISVQFTNTRHAAIPTSAATNWKIAIIITAISGVLAFILITRKKKKYSAKD